jgi:hypothetical protein
MIHKIAEFVQQIIPHYTYATLRRAPLIVKFNRSRRGGDLHVVDQEVLHSPPHAWGSRINHLLAAGGASADGVFLVCLADIEYQDAGPHEYLIITHVDVTANDISSHVFAAHEFEHMGSIETFEHLPSLMECLRLTAH